MHQINTRRQSAVPATRKNARRSPRRGALMVEMVVCTILLSMVGLILAPTIQLVMKQRKATRFETLAAIELNNLADRVRLTETADVSTLELSDWFLKYYPEAELTFEAGDQESDGQPSPLRMIVSRPDFDSQVTISHVLVVWATTGSERL